MDPILVGGVIVLVVAALLFKPASVWWFQWRFVRQGLRGERRPELEMLWRGDFAAVRARLAGSRDWERSLDRGDESADLTPDQLALWELITFEATFLRRGFSRRLRRWALAKEIGDDITDLIIAASVSVGDRGLAAQGRYRRRIARLVELAPDSFALRLARFSLWPRRELTPGDLDDLGEIANTSHETDLEIADATFECFLGVARARGSGSAESLAYRGMIQTLIVPDAALFRLLRSASGAMREPAWHRAVAVARRLTSLPS